MPTANVPTHRSGKLWNHTAQNELIPPHMAMTAPASNTCLCPMRAMRRLTKVLANTVPNAIRAIGIVAIHANGASSLPTSAVTVRSTLIAARLSPCATNKTLMARC